MWIYGFDTPTYRTIINFKNEYEELLENMMAIVLMAAEKEGLLNLSTIGLDGTFTKAYASNRNTVSEEILELAKNLINENFHLILFSSLVLWRFLYFFLGVFVY